VTSFRAGPFRRVVRDGRDGHPQQQRHPPVRARPQRERQLPRHGGAPREEQSIYNEASAFEGAAIVSMIERPAEKEGEVEKALEITMEDGITLTVELDSGEKRLIELGYKQELKRVLVSRPLSLRAPAARFGKSPVP